MDYTTLAAEGRSQLVEKRSRFIGYALPVTDEAEARAMIAAKGKEYHDARHVCWAFRLGPDGSRELSSDNGEPSGTAGRPMLSQLQQAGVTDAVVIVVRYFGGVKLGPSGLIDAYRTTAREAIDAAPKRVVTPTEVVGLVCTYAALDRVLKAARTAGVAVESQDLTAICALQLRVACDDKTGFCNILSKIDGVSLQK